MEDFTIPEIVQGDDLDQLRDKREEALEAVARRKDRALYGAWRAGFDFLYEVQGAGPTLGVIYVPSNAPDLDFPYATQRYDLRASTLGEGIVAELMEYNP